MDFAVSHNSQLRLDQILLHDSVVGGQREEVGELGAGGELGKHLCCLHEIAAVEALRAHLYRGRTRWAPSQLL